MRPKPGPGLEPAGTQPRPDIFDPQEHRFPTDPPDTQPNLVSHHTASSPGPPWPLLTVGARHAPLACATMAKSQTHTRARMDSGSDQKQHGRFPNGQDSQDSQDWLQSVPTGQLRIYPVHPVNHVYLALFKLLLSAAQPERNYETNQFPMPARAGLSQPEAE